jgi:hypothetical protein
MSFRCQTRALQSSPTATPADTDTELSGDLDTAPESIIALATRMRSGIVMSQKVSD